MLACSNISKMCVMPVKLCDYGDKYLYRKLTGLDNRFRNKCLIPDEPSAEGMGFSVKVNWRAPWPDVVSGNDTD